MSSNGFSWTFGSSDDAMQLYGVKALPTTVFIDKSGNIVETVVGGMDHATFEGKLAPLLQ